MTFIGTTSQHNITGFNTTEALINNITGFDMQGGFIGGSACGTPVP